MVDTWSISDDQGWSWICFCFSQSLNSLSHIATHTDLSNIYITIAHCNTSKVFLLGLFTACSELSYSTGLSRLGSLTTCIGVNLGIVNHDVDIFSGSQNMVYTAETDIVSPSVTTEDPLGFLS